MKNKISFEPHPKFNHRFFGIDYGKEFHCNALFRAECLEKLHRQLRECYGQYTGVVPKKSFLDLKITPQVGIQPLDFFNAALGGKLDYSPDEAVWSHDRMLAHIESMDDVKSLPELDWDNIEIYQDYCDQLELLKKNFPGFQTGSFQNIEFERGEGLATLVIHTPYTTAFRLMGEKILEFMMLEEDLAEAVFDYIERQYLNFFEVTCHRFGWKPDGIHLGDCAATMLSPDLFERFSVPRYTRLAKRFGRIRLHSCGPSAHLIEKFANIPSISSLQIGMKSNLSRLRKLFPAIPILGFLDPVLIRNGSPSEVTKALKTMESELHDHYQILLSSVDPDTDPNTLSAMLETAGEMNRRNGWN